MTINLPSAMLGYMKAQAEALLTDTCAIYQRVEGSGVYGEPTQEFSLVSSGVACRVITIGNRFREQASQVGSAEALVDAYRLVCPAGTALDHDQRIKLTSTGEWWEIVDLITERTSETDVQAVITRVRP